MKNICLLSLDTDKNIRKDFDSFEKFSVGHKLIQFNNPINEFNLAQLKSQLVSYEQQKNTVFGCTSATATIGKYIEDHFINPLSCLEKWCVSNSYNKLSLITPYTEDVHCIVKNWLENKNIDVVYNRFLGFESDLEIQEIGEKRIKQEIKLATSKSTPVFVSCTALPIYPMLKQNNIYNLCPITSSNHIMEWYLNESSKS